MCSLWKPPAVKRRGERAVAGRTPSDTIFATRYLTYTRVYHIIHNIVCPLQQGRRRIYNGASYIPPRRIVIYMRLCAVCGHDIHKSTAHALYIGQFSYTHTHINCTLLLYYYIGGGVASRCWRRL